WGAEAVDRTCGSQDGFGLSARLKANHEGPNEPNPRDLRDHQRNRFAPALHRRGKNALIGEQGDDARRKIGDRGVCNPGLASGERGLAIIDAVSPVDGAGAGLGASL
ncbi:MAG: hypothetical protein WCI05_01800, partial [Myxococcales bacterium]